MSTSPGSIVWFEIRSLDVDADRTFYGSLFNWTFAPMSDYDDEYWVIEPPPPGIGGALLLASPTPEGGTTDQGSLLYVAVDDLEAVLTQVHQLGGSLARGITPLPDGSRFAIIQDPMGGVMGLWSSG